MKRGASIKKAIVLFLTLLFVPTISYAQVIEAHHRVDKKFIALAVLQIGASIADFESTIHAEQPGSHELNSLYGANPGRPRIYGIGMSFTGAQILGERFLKRHGHERLSIISAVANTAIHTFGAVHNTRLP
jgi:hypothetical protein